MNSKSENKLTFHGFHLIVTDEQFFFHYFHCIIFFYRIVRCDLRQAQWLPISVSDCQVLLCQDLALTIGPLERIFGHFLNHINLSIGSFPDYLMNLKVFLPDSFNLSRKTNDCKEDNILKATLTISVFSILCRRLGDL
jgi:hypothetical protein